MKALFLVDSILALDSLGRVANALPLEWSSLFINYGGWDKKSRRDMVEYARDARMEYHYLGRHNRKEVNTILDRTNPNIVVFAKEETTPTESLFVSSCNEKGIPTLLVPHGALIIPASDIWQDNHGHKKQRYALLLLRQGIGKVFRGDISLPDLFHLTRVGIFRIRNDFKQKGTMSRYDRYSKIACYGTYMKELLLSYGVPQDNIIVTGNPRLDNVVHHREQNKRARRAVLLITDYLVEYGLWSAQQREQFVLDVHYAIARSGANISSWSMVKIHPVNERIEDYEAIFDKHNLFGVVHQSTDITKLTDQYSVAITLVSTAGLEVMLAGKPLIVYNPYNNTAAYSEEDGAFVAKDVHELSDAIKEALNTGAGDERKKKVSKFLRHQVGHVDGKSSSRVAKLITSMVK